MLDEREHQGKYLNYQSTPEKETGFPNLESFTHYITDLRNSSEIKAKILINFFPKDLQDGDLVVDVGTGPGKILKELKGICPSLKYVGVDISWGMLRCIKENCDCYFIQADASALPLADDSVTVIVASGILHEIYSYKNFSIQEVTNFLEEAKNLLRSGGRLIIKDPAKPDNPEEILSFRLRKDDGITLPFCDLAYSQPGSLSTYSKYLKFQQEFVRTNSIRNLLQYHYERDLFFAPAWYLSEFLRHMVLFKTSYWQREMKEQYGVFTASEIQQVCDALGLSTLFAISYFNPLHPAAITDKEISIWNSRGLKLKQSERLPTNLIIVVEKR